jgi:hypothetical protein
MIVTQIRCYTEIVGESLHVVREHDSHTNQTSPRTCCGAMHTDLHVVRLCPIHYWVL